MVPYNDRASTMRVDTDNLTPNTCYAPNLYHTDEVCYLTYCSSSGVKKSAKEEKAEAIKAKKEADRVRHMKELWKVERRTNGNRNMMRTIR